MGIDTPQFRIERPHRMVLAAAVFALVAAFAALNRDRGTGYSAAAGGEFADWRPEPESEHTRRPVATVAPINSAAVPVLPPREWRNLRRIRLAGLYPAEVLHVIDGDTFVARIPVWLGQDVVTHVRLRGIDTPELKGRCRAETDLAREAAQAVREFLHSGTVTLRDIGTGKYAGRVIARVYVTQPGRSAEDAGAMLLAGGYARRYGGGRRSRWCG
jgi:micrococcal nuclease